MQSLVLLVKALVGDRVEVLGIHLVEDELLECFFRLDGSIHVPCEDFVRLVRMCSLKELCDDFVRRLYYFPVHHGGFSFELVAPEMLVKPPKNNEHAFGQLFAYVAAIWLVFIDTKAERYIIYDQV